MGNNKTQEKNIMKTSHIIHRLYLITVLMVCLVACNQDRKTPVEQNVRLAPGEYFADEPENLSAYFEMLCSEHGAKVSVHIDDYDDSLKVWQAVRYLDDYTAGRRAYYPAKEVRHALDEMAFELGYCYSHGDYEDYYGSEIFFFRFLEQAVRLSPQVDYVTDFHCADGTAGILNYHEWSIAPLYSFLVYPTENSLRVSMVGRPTETKIEKLFRLTDDVGREYYLCSNNIYFCQYVFLRDGNSIREVASCTKFPMLDFDGDIVFNPRLLRWDYCTYKGSTHVRIEGTQSLLLKLDGKNSRFLIVQGD